jgi:hypothetical protein
MLRISSLFFAVIIIVTTVAISRSVRAGGTEGVNLAALEGWDIITSKDAPPSVAYAAEELQGILEKACGKRLPVKADADRPDHHIFVGPGEAMKKSAVGFEIEGFGPEDLRIVIRDGNIAIAGGEPRGTLYGVYTFLEDCLDVRFLTADHTHIPPVGGWKIVGPIDRTYHPPFAMRWSYYGEINRNPVFSARRRVNTVTNEPRLGGTTGIQNISHSFLGQIPSAKYGKEHPEYYCLIDGKRLAEVGSDAYDNEPCLTNPDVLRIVTEAVLAECERSPQSENVSVSQNDNDKYCRCEKCAAIDGREGTPMGSLLTFVNAVADKVAEKNPRIKVGTLSYWYTRKPPKTIQPRPNVQIQLCSIECCLIHAINDPGCPRNVEFCRDMTDWGRISSNVSIWNYNTNFTNYLLPCPNLRVIEPNVRFFVANQAKGVFMQAAGNAVTAELSDLRNYIISSLIWDPTRSGEKLMDEFLSLHYGKAAPLIRRYVDLIHDTAEASKLHRNCFAGRGEDYGLTEETAKKSLSLFEEALPLAGSPEIARRVGKASIGAYRLAIEPVWGREPSAVPAEIRDKMKPLVSRFLELCSAHGVDMSSEGEPFSAARARLERFLDAAPPAGEKR